VRGIAPSSPAEGCVAFVLKGYPRLSETFIAQEILALERRGLEILIVSLRRPTDRKTHPVHQLIRAALLYLPEYLYQEPRRVWRGWSRSRRRSGYRAARRAWLADLLRDPTPNRIRRFGQALVLAVELPDNVHHLHAHFLHTPASVARYAALIVGLDWTVSAHAKDIWTLPAWEKRGKLGEARWVVTCTEAGRSHLASLAARRSKIALCYHGLDLERFPAPPPRSSGSDGSDARHPAVILSIGKLVAKKEPRAWVCRAKSNGAVPRRNRRCLPAIARRICSYSPRSRPRTATATACPMSWSRRRANGSRALLRTYREYPS